MSLSPDGPAPEALPDVAPRDPLRIVVADDAVLLREGLVRLLAEDGHDVVAAVGDGPALVEAVLAHRPDVSVVDVRMPPTHTDEGLRAAVTARGQLPGAPMLVLSQYVEVSYAADLLADGSGAVGYLLKDRVAKVEEFLDALDRVARGATVLDPQVVAQLLAGQRRDDPLGALTARERQLLALIAEGHSNTAIARRLVLSNSAVEKHIGNIFAKLGLPPDDAQHRRVLAVLAYLDAWRRPSPPALEEGQERRRRVGCGGRVRHGDNDDGQRQQGRQETERPEDAPRSSVGRSCCRKPLP